MKKLESGRSMIEMLGVLAIIGVLSIGGLAGYTMAMNRWRAAAISDYASRCVVVSQTKGTSGIAEVDTCKNILNEDGPSGYTAEITAATADSTTVTIGNMTEAVQGVLKDRFSGNINGVCFSKTNSTFTFSASCS